jgi:glycosyltransferase involved in cell wall biosynthesis
MAALKIAIMMASLNHEKFVEEAIESIYAQNYPNLKVVVCDDASTDGNLERLELLARKHGFVLLRNDVRQGIILTLNRCFEQCSDADYFYALASDDVLQPRMLERCLEEMGKWPEAGMLLGSHTVIDGYGKETGRSRGVRSSSVIRLESVWETYQISFQFQRGEFTRSVYPMTATGNAEDRFLFLSCILSKYQVVQTNIPFIKRRIHGANISLSDEARCSAEDGWGYFTGHPDYAAKRRTTLRRHMLCCLALPNHEKDRFRQLFSQDRRSIYYLLYCWSFWKPFQASFSVMRRIEKVLSSWRRPPP